MARKTAYRTSNQIIETIKRRIFFPTSEQTFTDDDLLEFCNDELMGSQVPSVLQYHEEYFVYTERIPLDNTTRYPIPNRAVGMRLRAVFFEDSGGNFYELNRILPSDAAFYQNITDVTSNPYRYMIENNDIVILGGSIASDSVGYLNIKFYLRPNQLVVDDQAFIVNSFQKAITLTANLIAGDSIKMGETTFVAVSGTPTNNNEFQVGGTSITTASNLTDAINQEGTYSATNGSPATNVIIVNYSDITTEFSSEVVALEWSNDITFYSNNPVPSGFIDTELYDFLQTNAGHKTYLYDKTISKNGVSVNTLTFPKDNTPNNFRIGDYICLANECIIPQIPSDLHNLLIERTCERILSSLGDFDGATKSLQKISEMEQRQGTMIDNRVEGNPMKVFNKNSLLRIGKVSRRNLI